MKMTGSAVARADNDSLGGLAIRSGDAVTLARSVLYAVSVAGLLVLLLTSYLVTEIITRMSA